MVPREGDEIKSTAPGVLDFASSPSSTLDSFSLIEAEKTALCKPIKNMKTRDFVILFICVQFTGHYDSIIDELLLFFLMQSMARGNALGMEDLSPN
jgi:hypothetical protein